MAQNENNSNSDKKRLNHIYLTSGTIFGFFGILNFNYERNLTYKSEQFFTSHWIKFSAGRFQDWSSEGPQSFIGMTSMTGKNKNHLEVNYGFGLLGAGSPFYFGPAGSVGYRRQNPSGGITFRTGIGYPEAIYLSLGVTL